MSDVWSNVVTGVSAVLAGWGSAWFTLRHATKQAESERQERRRHERAQVYADVHRAVAGLLVTAAEGRDITEACSAARHACGFVFFVAPGPVAKLTDQVGRAISDLRNAAGQAVPYSRAFDALDGAFADLTRAMRTDIDD